MPQAELLELGRGEATRRGLQVPAQLQAVGQVEGWAGEYVS